MNTYALTMVRRSAKECLLFFVQESSSTVSKFNNNHNLEVDKMKLYLVYRHSPVRLFLSRELAEKYIELVNTSPYEIDRFKIIEMEPSDELFNQLRIETTYWCHYELRSNGGIHYYLNSYEQENWGNKMSTDTEEQKYEEKLWPRSTKVKSQILSASFITALRRKEIEERNYEERYGMVCEKLMTEINQLRTEEGWSVEKVNEWLTKEHFQINE
jgi:hypothetical protein